MKKILLIMTVAMVATSCNFLNVDDYFKDTFQKGDIFANKINAEKYFNGAVNAIPREGRLYYWSNIPGATGSDEAVSMGTYNNGFLDVAFPGTELTTNRVTYTEMGWWQSSLNVWPDCYKVIRKVNTILANVDAVPDMNITEKADLRARARFLRAYAYYWILRQNGPMVLVGDELMETNGGPEYYNRPRATYDECVDYICSELDEVAEGLPVSQPVDMFGSPSKGAALALVARIRLHAASPLFNGGDSARRYFGNFTRRTDGVHYISQTYDESKWALAAASAKKVIDLGVYQLHTVPADEFTAELPASVPSAAFPGGAGGIDPIRSYAEMFNGETVDVTNKEIIWGSRTVYGNENVNNQQDIIFPVGNGGNSVMSIPQRIIDSYLMADGRTIDNASPEYPYDNRMYDPTCVVLEDKQLSEFYTLKAGTYSAYDNREPRFYASIGFSGRFWEMGTTTQADKKNLVVKYHNGGSNGRNKSSDGRYNLTGYTCTKWVHPRDARDGSGARQIAKSYYLIRYAEVLLSYAEALNNLTGSHTVDGETFTRDTEQIAWAFNQVRYRGGVPGATDAELANAATFNKAIQRERMVEFLHENQRYYDLRRWGLTEEVERQPLMGMNVDLAEWAGFYAPTVIAHRTIRERAFNANWLLLPLHRDELRKVPMLDQNPGWDK